MNVIRYILIASALAQAGNCFAADMSDTNHLIACGINLFQQSIPMRRLCGLACVSNSRLIKDFSPRDVLNRSLLRRVEFGDDGVKPLLDIGADVGYTDRRGDTALVLAAKHGHRRAVQDLLEAEVDVNQEDAFGQPALMVAANRGHRDVVQDLLKAGADVKRWGSARSSMLRHSVFYGYVDMVQDLVAAGADINAFDVWVSLANARKCMREMAHILLGAGANVNQLSNGSLALMPAAFFGNTELIQILLDNGADINKASRIGKTVLMYVVNKNIIGQVQFFAENPRIDFDCNNQLERAIEFARDHGYGNMITLLEVYQVHHTISKQNLEDLSDNTVNSF